MLRLFVGGMSSATTPEMLRNHFRASFEVANCVIIEDHVTKRSKGFGFIELVTELSAKEVITAFHKSRLDGRAITVNNADPKKKKEGQEGMGMAGMTRGDGRNTRGMRGEGSGAARRF